MSYIERLNKQGKFLSYQLENRKSKTDIDTALFQHNGFNKEKKKIEIKTKDVVMILLLINPVFLFSYAMIKRVAS